MTDFTAGVTDGNVLRKELFDDGYGIYTEDQIYDCLRLIEERKPTANGPHGAHRIYP